MASAEFLRERVKSYFTENPIGSTASDAFAPWWIAKRFSLSPTDANRQCGDGTDKDGFDGFHFDLEQKPPVLHLVRAELSEGRDPIRKAFADLPGLLERLGTLLRGTAPEKPERNTVTSRLFATLQKHPSKGKGLRIELSLLHLCTDPREVLLQAFSAQLESLQRQGRKTLPNHRFTITLLGPNDLQPDLSATHAPAAEQTLSFEGVKLPGTEGETYYVGFGKLGDLVRLYSEYGDQLFSKNVRAFLYKAFEQGPAYYMRQTLGQICDKRVAKPKRMDPSTFAVFHNGVTLHAVSASITGNKITIREPNILNGCQTVKNAYLYQHKLEKDLDTKAWDQIMIPLRILVTAEEDLIRTVTVSNNRQNSIRPAAFRANDPIQLELSERFRAMGIFYERQEGAFENLRRSSPNRILEEYGNAVESPLTMEELAQTIATVSTQPALSVAAKLGDLFDETCYRRLFSANHLKDSELLIFLRNAFRATQLALKSLRTDVQKLSDLRQASFKFPTFRVLGRYAVKQAPELVERYGRRVESRFGSSHPLRAELVKMMRSGNSGFQQLLFEVWHDGKAWKSATDKDAVEEALRKLRLTDFDVFEQKRGTLLAAA